jgi:histidine triad (HIT) family protein
MSTLFEKIANREISAEFLHEDELCFVIRDIAPQAPVHLLIIPRKPLENLMSATDGDTPLLGHLLQIARLMGGKYGDGKGYRVVINNGKFAGQIVPHLHVHLLAGKQLKEKCD